MGNLSSNELKPHDKAVRIVNTDAKNPVTVLTSGGQLTTFAPGEEKEVAEKLAKEILAERFGGKSPLAVVFSNVPPAPLKVVKKAKKAKK